MASRAACSPPWTHGGEFWAQPNASPSPSKDPHCSDVTAPPVGDYDIRNISTKTFTVPLASGTTLSIVGPSGQQDDYVVVPMAEKTWATSSDGPQIVVTYATNAAGEISQIKEWWRP